jgi:hypothetical protein
MTLREVDYTNTIGEIGLGEPGRVTLCGKEKISSNKNLNRAFL